MSNRRILNHTVFAKYSYYGDYKKSYIEDFNKLFPVNANNDISFLFNEVDLVSTFDLYRIAHLLENKLGFKDVKVSLDGDSVLRGPDGFSATTSMTSDTTPYLSFDGCLRVSSDGKPLSYDADRGLVIVSDGKGSIKSIYRFLDALERHIERVLKQSLMMTSAHHKVSSFIASNLKNSHSSKLFAEELASKFIDENRQKIIDTCLDAYIDSAVGDWFDSIYDILLRQFYGKKGIFTNVTLA